MIEVLEGINRRMRREQRENHFIHRQRRLSPSVPAGNVFKHKSSLSPSQYDITTSTSRCRRDYNLRSGPIVPSLLCLLMSALATIGPDTKSHRSLCLRPEFGRNLIGWFKNRKSVRCAFARLSRTSRHYGQVGFSFITQNNRACYFFIKRRGEKFISFALRYLLDSHKRFAEWSSWRMIR